MIGDVDRGLSEILWMFCANGPVYVLIGSHVPGSMYVGDLVWFLIGFPVLGSDP